MTRCLWITRQDPRPADSGDLIYTIGLLKALAATETCEITVLAHRAEHNTGETLPGIRCELPAAVPGKSLRCLLSKLPSDAHRLGNPEMRKALSAMLDEGFDCAVIDQAANAWALDLLPAELPLIYISHNHEATVRAEVAGTGEGSPWFRWALSRDAAKYGRLEEELSERANAISAITPRDASLYQRDFPEKKIKVVSPGYSGEVPESHTPLTTDTPRRVILAGTFEWLAKRRNLEAFLNDSAEPFDKAGITFHVVGKCDPAYFEELGKDYPDVSFFPNVRSMEPHLCDARIGLIPEALGGGFKLKALDYIFRGLPLASIGPALSGLPLNPGHDCLAAASTSELAELIASQIDDLEFLNQAATNALNKCRDAFEWADRGTTLSKIICS